MIYVCIPTHNEATTIGVLLWKTRRVLNEFGRPFTVVVHDDASTDDTTEVLGRYRRTLPLEVLRSEEKLGYGRSVDTLLRHVQETCSYPKRDCAVVMQADFTEDPADVVSLVKMLEGGADIVAGTLSPRPGSRPFAVRAARWAARTLVAGVSRSAHVTDAVSGLRAYRVIVLKKALRDRPPDEPLVRSDGWAANVELIARLAPHARRIVEVPLELRYDLQVRPSRLRAVATLVSLLRLRGATLAEESV